MARETTGSSAPAASEPAALSSPKATCQSAWSATAAPTPARSAVPKRAKDGLEAAPVAAAARARSTSASAAGVVPGAAETMESGQAARVSSRTGTRRARERRAKAAESPSRRAAPAAAVP
jgi:hypothetical protein